MKAEDIKVGRTYQGKSGRRRSVLEIKRVHGHNFIHFFEVGSAKEEERIIGENWFAIWAKRDVTEETKP
jgi:hypothetical protein